MKSKEAIRNKIISYTNQVWGTKKIERLDLLVQMMIGTLTDELYLVQNKLNDVDSSLLEKIAKKLTPEKYIAVRPAHTILQMKPNDPIVVLEPSNTFTLEWIPDGFIDEKADAITFHPVAETCLYNIKIEYLFHHKQLYAFDSNDKKQLITTVSNQSPTNSVWLGLDVATEIDNLRGLSFYLDFPELSEIHELYEVLPYTKCFINGKEIKLKRGFPVHSKDIPAESDADILHFYNDHYFTIDEDVYLRDLKPETVPEALGNIIHPEQTGELRPKYWGNLQFSPYFTPKYLRDMIIAINTFPVSNKRLIKTTIIKSNLSKTTLLPCEPGEKLLSVDSLIDNRERNLVLDVVVGSSEDGTYHLETINRAFVEEYGLIDYIEQLLDLMDDKRSVFSGINKDQAAEGLSALTNITNEDNRKVDVNDRSKGDGTTYLSINPYKNTSTVNVSYWVTYGKHLNDIPAKKVFMPDKTPRFDGLTAVSLCELQGAKEFTDIRDIMSIDKYIFTSKDRIITEHNIKCFCESELGRIVEKVEVRLDGKISPKPYEGIVRVINIYLTPSVGYRDLLYQKGTLKNLKVRLQKRSPEDYNYNIEII
jgi:hypothetical protein